MTMLETALQYFDSGLQVLPVRADGSKAPAIKTWRQWIDKRQTRDDVCELFAKNYVAIGIVCGAVSGGLTVIDFDRPGSFDAWRELVESVSPGLLERLPLVKTPGGHHVYMRSAQPARNQKLATASVPYEKNGKKSNVIIETRGEGGYVVAPPSAGYELIAGGWLGVQ
jgi:putative DNA primase/helicase